MAIYHYDVVIKLIQDAPNIKVRSSDSKEAGDKYIDRNPGLSFIAV